jgi:hypothetical protein
MKCRHCAAALELVFMDLGSAPPSNAYLTEADLRKPEKWYPLRVLVCSNCWLVQTEDYAQADELFTSDYAYFSSTSSSWLKHAADYAAMVTKRFSLGQDSFVVEIASNDGYLLKNFVGAGIPCLGIEPTDGTAAAAEALGVPVMREFFGAELGAKLADEGKQADLIAGNNVYAHVPNINDFTLGLKHLLKSEGTITLEFPHLYQLIKHCQFDTIYHEHFSYLSLYTVRRIFAQAGLMVYDVEELPTHGGSLRIYGAHQGARSASMDVERILSCEQSMGMQTQDPYESFQSRADAIKDAFVSFLLEQKEQEKMVAGYGAAAKGNTLLNYAGVRPDLLQYVCDAAPSKQGKYMPGSRIPIVAPHMLKSLKPEWVVILPWNIKDEVTDSMSYAKSWGANFSVFFPEYGEF